MAFVVNGADWHFDGHAADQIEALIGKALDFVMVSMCRDEEVLIGEDFQTQTMFENLTLWDLFSESATIKLSGETRQELAAWLLRAKVYLDDAEWPDGVDDPLVSISSAPSTSNVDVAWVHHSVRNGRSVACFTLGESKCELTTSAAGSVTIHFVGDDSGRKRFWRDEIRNRTNKASFILFAPHAYPDLYFVDDVLEDVDQLSGGYSASRNLVQKSLEVLDDWGYWAFSCPPPATSPHDSLSSVSNEKPSNQLIERRFKRLGLMAAPEKPNVRADRVCREARETVLKHRSLYCEWHIKLELHKNRIHFHGPVPESENKIIVGMIHEHLPLP